MDKRILRHLVVTVLLSLGTSPALGQYLYLDTNGDGLNFDREVAIGNIGVVADDLHPGVEAVDVYLVTDTVADGSAATCTSGESFTIGSYQVILRYAGRGFVTVHGWTDAMGFDAPNIGAGDGTLAVASPDTWVGRAGSAHLPPGSHKLGTLHVTVTGTPILVFGINSAINGSAETAFASECDGAGSDGLIRLGPLPEVGITADFHESFGSTYHDAVVSTTWGKIKEHYR